MRKKRLVHFVLDAKHCGKFKVRLVVDGHHTKEPNETVYLGVVSLRILRLAMFLAELNSLQLWGADVGNAYLQALTKEKHQIKQYQTIVGQLIWLSVKTQYTMDEDGTLVADPRKYVEKILESYEKCLVVNQRRPEHHQWQDTTQKMTYLNFVIKTKSNNIKQL